jgi:2,5-diketo-D-gluconate reductase A
MDTTILNNGVQMPMLGFGVFQVPDAAQCEQSVYDAITAGYRLIDTAASYMNEEAVGRAVRRSGVPRRELFITTKLWVQDAGYDKTKASFERQIKLLGLDYLDLYLIHQPYGDIYGSWRAMEELYKEGRIRAIGVCNFSDVRFVDLAEFNEVVPAINQVEVHPFCQQNTIKKIMDEYKVQMEAWGPLAEGQRDIFKNEVLSSIGRKYGKTIAQVILRWHVQRGVVAIPKSVHRERIVENYSIWDFKLSEEDMNAIAAMDTNQSLYGDTFTSAAAVKRFKGRTIHE